MKAKLYIPKPCHENWDKMSPAEKGRHCEVCNKVVKDLTHLSKTEVIQFLSQSKENNTCGRVKTSILDNPQPAFSSLLYKTWRPAAKLMVLASFLWVDTQTLQAQTTTQNISAGGLKYYPEEPQISEIKRKLTVIVKDKENNPIESASIRITGTTNKKLTELSDSLGQCSFEFTDNHLDSSEINIVVTHERFRKKKIKGLYLNKTEHTVEIVLMEMVFTVSPDIFQHVTLGSIVAPIEYKIDPVILNPVPEGQTTAFELDIFPNPTSGFITVNTNKSELFNLEVINSSGQILQQITNISFRADIDMSPYANGIYYFRIFQNGVAIETKKVMVVK